MDKNEAILILKKIVGELEKSDKKEKWDSKPMLFFIKEEKIINAADGFACGDWYRHDEDCEMCFDSEEELNEFLASDDNENEYSADDFYAIGHQKVDNFQQLSFLTRESCQEHIDDNRHHYTKPSTYSRGVWRDPLMEGLFKALHVLYGEKGEE